MTTPMRINILSTPMTQCLTTEHLVVFEADDWDERDLDVAGPTRFRTYAAVVVEGGVWFFPLVVLDAQVTLLGGLRLNWVSTDAEDYRHVGPERAATLVDELVTALHGHIPGLAPSRSSTPQHLPDVDRATTVVWQFSPLGGRRADN
jgi:hypothetical protein